MPLPLHIEIDGCANDEDDDHDDHGDDHDDDHRKQPHPRTPKPLSIPALSKSYSYPYPSPPPFPKPPPGLTSLSMPSSPTTTTTSSSSSASSSKQQARGSGPGTPRPSRRTLLYRTESALARVEQEQRKSNKPSLLTLEMMGDAYATRVIGYRKDNLQRALLSMRFARQLAKHGSRDHARLCIKMGRLVFDLCNTSVSSFTTINNTGTDTADANKISSALQLVNTGLQAYTERPDWCDRPRDARAYVSAFVCRGLIFDALYRHNMDGGPPAAARLPQAAGGDGDTLKVMTVHNSLSQQQRRRTPSFSLFDDWFDSASSSTAGGGDRHDGNDNDDNNNDNDNDNDDNDDHDHSNDENHGGDDQQHDENRLNDEGRLNDVHDHDRQRRGRYLNECIQCLELALSAGTDMISSWSWSSRVTPPSSPLAFSVAGAAAAGSSGWSTNAVISRCRVAVEGVERVRVAVSLARAYCAAHKQYDGKSGSGNTVDKARKTIAGIMEMACGLRVCADGSVGGVHCSGGKGKSKARAEAHEVYLGVDCGEVERLRRELKMIGEALKSTGGASPSRCVVS